MSGWQIGGGEPCEAKASQAQVDGAGLGKPAAAAVPSASPSRGLEQRYRWLLSAFPREHRAKHGEEMMGVLLAGAREGQTRPSPGESLNLVAGAARIRLQRAGRALGGAQWRDALAVMSVVAPLTMLALLAEAIPPLPLALYLGGYIPGFPLTWAANVALMPAAWVIVAAFVLLRMRRAALVAAAAAFAVLVLLYVNRLRTVGIPVSGGPRDAYAPVEVFLGTLTLVAIMRSDGPRRGLEILGRRRAVLIVVALLAWVAVHQAAGMVIVSHQQVTHLLTRYASLGELAVLIPVSVMCVRDPVGGRVALLASPAVTPHGVVALIAFATSAGTTDRFVAGISAQEFVSVHHYVVSPPLVMWALYLVLAVVVVGLALGARAIRRRPAPSPA